MSSQAKHEDGKANGSDARQTTTADACDPETGLPPTGDDRGEAQRRGIGARVLAFFAPSDPVTGVDGGWAWLCLLVCKITLYKLHTCQLLRINRESWHLNVTVSRQRSALSHVFVIYNNETHEQAKCPLFCENETYHIFLCAAREGLG